MIWKWSCNVVEKSVKETVRLMVNEKVLYVARLTSFDSDVV